MKNSARVLRFGRVSVGVAAVLPGVASLAWTQQEEKSLSDMENKLVLAAPDYTRSDALAKVTDAVYAIKK